MNSLTREERLKVLELAAEIASEAARNTNVVWMLEFQEELVERLYRRMSALLEEPNATGQAGAAGGAASEGEDGAVAPRPRKVAKRRKAPAKAR